VEDRRDHRLTIRFDELGVDDVALVGGKNASLGELRRRLTPAGVRVPDGFAVTAAAYRELVAANGLDEVIEAGIAGYRADRTALPRVGRAIRDRFLAAEVPEAVRAELVVAHARLVAEAGVPITVAVRSSATAEDLPEASFAGQHESYLNVTGEDAVLRAYVDCVASLFTDRAIAYREEHGFEHSRVALSVGVQRMVRSDRGAAGVMFTLDTESGFDDVVLVDGAWGLGEAVVKGATDPDRFRVFKGLLDRGDARPILSRQRGAKELKIVYTDLAGVEAGEEPVVQVPTTAEERAALVLDDDDVLRLARWAVLIEEHYGRPMDIEWARDGLTRPETVQARRRGAAFVQHRVRGAGEVLARGLSVGDGAAVGEVCVLAGPGEIDRFPDGGVLVAEITDPDWVPAMRRASAVVTDHGGRTSHAAIVSRELGVPAVLGCGDATSVLTAGRVVTVDCTRGEEGLVTDGAATVERSEVDLGEVPATRTRVMLNLADPDAALRWWQLPADGIGLARMEFVVSEHIRVHPMALAHPERITDPQVRAEIDRLTEGHASGADYFVDRLASGVATLAAPFHPKPVILRLSDFKTNEYARLLGGAPFEPTEENPMLGWRGASRYYDPGYRDGFALECRGIRRAREELGFDNVVVMVPFCRTPEEADRVLEVMAEEGLERGRAGLEVYVMAEIPSNVILAEEFAERFDGFSIGSNDLTQLTLGVDRDSEALSRFDATDPAVLHLIRDLIPRAHAAGGRKVGFCGQAPSNDPTYARFLVEAGIDSVSVTPDSFLAVKAQIAAAEAELG
jgi:pyruvate,water dikinase